MEIKEFNEEIYVEMLENGELYDYITNLQEQLHQASLDIQELTERDIECPSWCDKLTNLQQENERLKKMNMHEHKYGSDMEEKYLIEKTKTKEQSLLLIDYQDMEQKLEDCKSRIEKAVEYGKSCINKDLDLETLDEPYKTTFKTAYEIHNNYLDILNGESNE